MAEIYNDTKPFSYPDTYIDRLSFVMNGVRIQLYAGAHESGFARIFINEKQIDDRIVGKRISLPVSGGSFIHVRNQRTVTISLGPITIDVVNSNYFLNMDIRLSSWEIVKSGAKYVSVEGLDPETADIKISSTYPDIIQMYGLLGQTWRNIKYDHGRVYQGDVDDYLVNYLLDFQFVYSLFEVED